VFVLKSAGHGGGNLHVEIHNNKITGWACGEIEGGFGMKFENEEGGWVVDTQDLLALAKLIEAELDVQS